MGPAHDESGLVPQEGGRSGTVGQRAGLTLRRGGALLLLAGAAACGPASGDKSSDGFINRHGPADLVAGIWIDPEGCDHWIIDDGLEGYLSERLQPDGRPVCSGVGEPGTAVGPFKEGSPLPDLL